MRNIALVVACAVVLGETDYTLEQASGYAISLGGVAVYNAVKLGYFDAPAAAAPPAAGGDAGGAGAGAAAARDPPKVRATLPDGRVIELERAHAVPAAAAAAKRPPPGMAV